LPPHTMPDSLSRREFSRRAALTGLGLGVARLAPTDMGHHAAPADDTAAMQPHGRLAAAEFPHQRAGVYLNHAASSPLPQRSSEALRAYAGDRERLFHLYQTG